MPRYSPERKEALLKKLLPPHNLSVAEVARQEGISDATLYAWRTQAKTGGTAVPGEQTLTDNWSAEAKLAVVIEMTTFSEIELSEYCRRKRLYPQQVKAWKAACLAGQQSTKVQQQAERDLAKADKKRIRQRERDLNRKEKALAEAAALPMLRKKLNAYWDDDSEDN
jgi:transposase-like protein